MELVALEEGIAEMTASDGLAPARCGGLYEAAHTAACSAIDGVEAAVRRAMMMDQDYELVH
eukprot:SAG11_NODE_523_length_8775_cov_29.592900_9_plen_60_part_01